VPIVLAGAKLVTDQVLKHLGLHHQIPKFFPDEKKSGRNISPLDVQQSSVLWQAFQVILALAMTYFLWIVLQRAY